LGNVRPSRKPRKKRRISKRISLRPNREEPTSTARTTRRGWIDHRPAIELGVAGSRKIIEILPIEREAQTANHELKMRIKNRG